MKKQLIILSVFVVNTFLIFPQANLIQSIDFDSEQRVVYALTGNYDSSYAIRYKDGNFEIWNLTKIFNLPFYWIATGVDKQDNIWAYVNNKLCKYDGFTWGSLDIPGLTVGYKYADLAIDDQYLWLSDFESGVNNNTGVHRLKLSDSTWTILNSTNSGYPAYPANGTIFLKGDSTFIGTNKGLVMIYNDIASVVLDTSNSTLGTQSFYCFYVDSQENRWLGTYNFGLIKWINNSNFEIYNTSNSNLPNNFVNAIAEDSEGNLWLATDGGFACLKNDSIISYSNLVGGSLAALAVDNLDRVWMGEIGTGNLYVFDGSNLTLVTNINEQQMDFIPNQFLLYQNYPNPFNPTTNIGFQIADFGFVSLKVYDILGNEIATLVNEEFSPGEYEVELSAKSGFTSGGNAYSLSSGIYFYTLSAGEFIQTKKMILLR
jgi:hypothetical protein